MDKPKYTEYEGNKYHLSNGYYRRCIFYYMHREVWEKENGQIPKGYHIHHKDGDKTNNLIKNLECLSASDHHKLTYIENLNILKGLRTANLKQYKRTKVHKKRMSKWSKEFWKNKQPVKSFCHRCGKEYETLMVKSRKWCSSRCRKDYEYETMQEKRCCEMCQKEFKVYIYSKTNCCSQKCAAIKGHKTRGKNEHSNI